MSTAREHDARMRRDEVLSFDYHRNGGEGDGFYVALVRAHDADQRVLTVIVPAWAAEIGDARKAAAKAPSGCVPCYAIDPSLAAGPWTNPGTVEFGVNSWRGDHYFDLVVAAVKAGAPAGKAEEYASTAMTFRPVDRRPELKLEHHRIAFEAASTREEANELLDWAIANAATPKALRAEVRRRRGRKGAS